MKNVVLLGSTGSIGTSTVKVAEDLPDDIRLVGLAAGGNAELLAGQVRKFRPELISIASPEKAAELRTQFDGIRVASGEEGLLELATLPSADIVLIAIVGTAGLKPALAAIRAGKDIAVASKEILVMAGEIVMAEARKHGVRVLPVDSEHSAIFQCLDGREPESVRRLILTASGGPFRETPAGQFADITVEQALKHPSWAMGRKITIDSATMFNKGLEMIEARWLFGIPMPQVDVVVHPQSVVHSMVEFVDGSILSQLSTPDMCLPIQYALTCPSRAASERVQTNLAALGRLDFEAPDLAKFPALGQARRAGEIDGTLPAVLNAANEVAVDAFCDRQTSFPGISDAVGQVMDRHEVIGQPSLEQILQADAWAREAARDVLGLGQPTP
ncbi:MAG: 1-deoxy-D-xylulose-5-phosphate reductoisomerase [Verrucomicrobiota bacterium]|jgi:1-deoxy-D-xylulose-5-phosphate reductoisomerase|nr:1-deoxy-D-xylulose-5-phosphate reductoisomerase [Verrucomicrobiota bacterium]MDP6250360.1 1-deoxy-D-xylulose-5-phosphate reductoisomerase [Verrucomicrobiota bacterium]MDP7179007.1 1-deoxy-D-xylulose-5-phosphate reductoisomerase [Verrucomicrobiota bacterium]MDP7291041.1 1-deoxy-D-xylulose-5-phosphate reductoisomerase [Verrucomicrobiota bacterium]MDP7440720.1 1-deoxy-D-xylulose-5-phosphate reductoisomerase [Verrucomicrobiota bacterium]|tara:strand:- start:4460 stop:5620 length:1161 start_codon:yes stop_codon:yes gene_type:complete